MSDELHENWVPGVAQRTGATEHPDQEWVGQSEVGEHPDQEWLPEHAVVDGFGREPDGHLRCLFCSTRVPAKKSHVEQHRAEHEESPA